MDISRESALQAASAANIISKFVAYEQVQTLSDLRGTLFEPIVNGKQGSLRLDASRTGVVVLCPSAVLLTTETAFSMVKELIETTQSGSIVLVLCGGIGHSTQLMHDAISRHPRYSRISDRLRTLPEARMLEAIAEQFWQLRVDSGTQASMETATRERLTILVEDTSTNCALNAVNTRKLLDANGYTSPHSIVVAQDPTMCRRTVAAFEQVYANKADETPVLRSWPTFVPKVLLTDSPSPENTGGLTSLLSYDFSDSEDNRKTDLWGMDRLMSLLVGEIPRMRDDENGYGPRGKGSIVHVDIPKQVEDAWKLLYDLLGQSVR
ncbi:hypothetical protein NXS19_001723 [Fusarium pseudograminearum]|uniref:Uncharacterized protein n=1 Tax=Fusarium pseudograminearum (strain CS3096) TaxID=1028729 RepID=K3UHQ7_FUSPC|nr:hypothetical protein FPSE_08570 [Fusarium pseudograminearum CS3096]EKJ71331.1 hypothetical protein FPSE_08570 [Fusarium pseudograminearum CS3096]KAF0634606.1 hypothetical protein FPSE5266_08570 [Fusarium pseudograminearum]UZP33907.1 hypothetical protein NXS19_001723 [Fusarium pseudograminearum]